MGRNVQFMISKGPAFIPRPLGRWGRVRRRISASGQHERRSLVKKEEEHALRAEVRLLQEEGAMESLEAEEVKKDVGDLEKLQKLVQEANKPSRSKPGVRRDGAGRRALHPLQGPTRD